MPAVIVAVMAVVVATAMAAVMGVMSQHPEMLLLAEVMQCRAHFVAECLCGLHNCRAVSCTCTRRSSVHTVKCMRVRRWQRLHAWAALSCAYCCMPNSSGQAQGLTAI